MISIVLLYYILEIVELCEIIDGLIPFGRKLLDLAAILLANYDFWLETAWSEILERFKTENQLCQALGKKLRSQHMT